MSTLPDYVTTAQVESALRALGFEFKGIGLIDVHIDPMPGRDVITVRRRVKNDDGNFASPNISTVEIPIDRRDAVAAPTQLGTYVEPSRIAVMLNSEVAE